MSQLIIYAVRIKSDVLDAAIGGGGSVLILFALYGLFVLIKGMFLWVITKVNPGLVERWEKAKIAKIAEKNVVKKAKAHLVDGAKICDDCKGKNNPTFGKCWKCGAIFEI